MCVVDAATNDVLKVGDHKQFCISDFAKQTIIIKMCKQFLRQSMINGTEVLCLMSIVK